jgi:5'-3' exonuclease
MTTYVIVDTSNLALRVRFGTRAPDFDTTIGLAMHIIFSSIRMVWNQFQADHTVFALEGRSWRKDYYQPYKANRRELAAARTEAEVEEDQQFFAALNSLTDFLRDKTNATVLRDPNGEADDMIARWIALHPDDQHVIVSTDSDFLQLLAPNVKIYNGIAGLLYTDLGVWDKNGNAAVNKKGEPLGVPNPQWLLFEKVMRGDDSDNVMSAYPGVRKKRLLEAFDNRHEQGYAWNNLMLSRWSDHHGHEIRVKDAYERNLTLIDLTAQPSELKQQFDHNIKQTVNQPSHQQIGFGLMKFASQWGLVKIQQSAQDYSACLSKSYQGPLLDQADSK